MTDSTLAERNPFRYRGYYYDVETGLYYLNSRYYNPETMRFVNADEVDIVSSNCEYISTKNLYLYCDNNPICKIDEDGMIGISLGVMAVGGLIGAVIGAAANIVTQKVTGESVNWKSVGIAAASGFVSGAIAASPLGLTGQVVAGGIIGAGTYIADSKVKNEKITVGGIINSTVCGLISGRIGGSGANQYKTLSNAISYTQKTIAKETKRVSYKYTQKAIANATTWLSEKLAWTAWSASARFSAGIAASNTITSIYNYIEKRLTK